MQYLLAHDYQLHLCGLHQWEHSWQRLQPGEHDHRELSHQPVTKHITIDTTHTIYTNIHIYTNTRVQQVKTIAWTHHYPQAKVQSFFIFKPGVVGSANTRCQDSRLLWQCEVLTDSPSLLCIHMPSCLNNLQCFPVVDQHAVLTYDLCTMDIR